MARRMPRSVNRGSVSILPSSHLPANPKATIGKAIINPRETAREMSSCLPIGFFCFSGMSTIPIRITKNALLWKYGSFIFAVFWALCQGTRVLTQPQDFAGAEGGGRTHDLCFTKALLYQLSYFGMTRCLPSVALA